MPAGAVKINANENPSGPCAEASEAIHNVIKHGGRYLYENTFDMAATLAETEGVPPEYVMPFAGSSDPLHRAVLAFTSPTRSFVVADPGYEAGAHAARISGADVNLVSARRKRIRENGGLALRAPQFERRTKKGDAIFHRAGICSRPVDTAL